MHDFTCLDLDIYSLPASTSQRLMDHDPRVGHRVTLALRACSQKECAHGCCKAEANSLHICPAHFHGIVDTHASCDGSSRRVDEELDVLRRVNGVQEEELTDDCIGHKIVDLAPQEHDAFPLEERKGISVHLRQPVLHVQARFAHVDDVSIGRVRPGASISIAYDPKRFLASRWHLPRRSCPSPRFEDARVDVLQRDASTSVS
mmetsp:Transcript_10725/g.66121  ORF Transcript_10725/g.66121 Transcript_10725/m.66121 type:complete len:203 (+) Transcript_10725:366-974(+)